MPGIKIVDEKKKPLQVGNNKTFDYHRWEHRATLSRNGRTFIVFVDNGVIVNGVCVLDPCGYIEEITSGNLERITDDNLFAELYAFANEKGFLVIQAPLRR